LHYRLSGESLTLRALHVCQHSAVYLEFSHLRPSFPLRHSRLHPIIASDCPTVLPMPLAPHRLNRAVRAATPYRPDHPSCESCTPHPSCTPHLPRPRRIPPHAPHSIRPLHPHLLFGRLEEGSCNSRYFSNGVQVCATSQSSSLLPCLRSGHCP
jgi:hypothetical protein